MGNPNVHTDITFWRKWAIQGNWNGFDIRDISDPDDPEQVSFHALDSSQRLSAESPDPVGRGRLLTLW
jgi:hypothetical protein